MKIKKWKILQSRPIFEINFFKLKSEKCELPDGRLMPRYYVFEFSDWVNIVPLTSQGEIILIEQYRHAGGDIYYEIPGGALDIKSGENLCAAACRELEEETGYGYRDVHFVAKHQPNPALQTNSMHTFIAYDCYLKSQQQLDPYEDIAVVLKPWKEVKEMIQSGKINHSIVLASLLLAEPFIEKYLTRNT